MRRARTSLAGLLLCGGLAWPAAADPGDASLAPPGACAQPRRELVTSAVQALPAGVSGPAADHFRPPEVRDTGDLDLLRTVSGLLGVTSTETSTTTASEPLVESVERLLVDPVLEPTLDPVLDPTLDPVLDPTLDPVLDPTLDPVLDPTLDPVLGGLQGAL